ncbi:MAG: riboflavin biosynthesis protein RibF [Gammaproteobacteria bacterium]|nr:riboflavin biosynthesis protein RibF [Gammaproteobacteria bacterium]
MKLVRYSQKTKLPSNSAVAVGNFDGLHRGHQKLLTKLVADSKKLGLQSVVCTFSPLPWQTIALEVAQSSDVSKVPQATLSSLRTKIELLQQYEIDIMLLVRFNPAFRSLLPAAFIKDFLVNQLNTHHLITGQDFRFGFARRGGAEQLAQAQQAGLFSYAPVDAYPDEQNKISSSRVRELLTDGDLQNANKLLGYRYFITGRVVQGNGLGGKLGFPTANLNLQAFVPSATGVYLCLAHIENQTKGAEVPKGLPALANFGYRPTVGSATSSKKFVAEAHILNFNENIYGKLLKLELIEYLRPEKKFAKLEELTAQIKQDRETALKILHNNPPM